MGNSSWSNQAYANLKTDYTTKSVNDIFTQNKSRSINKLMSPHGLTFRECRDSQEHPNTVAVSVFLDETGSMGRIPEVLIREKLGHLMDTIIKHGLPDAQVMFAAIGDHHTDSYPLQVGQFESGTDELNKWLTSIYLEGNGGGQSRESYLLAWLIAARHTSIDCMEKRGQRGLLFTIGDEKSWDKVDKDTLKNLLGYDEATELTDVQLLAEAQRNYHVFHIHVNETGYKDNQDVIGYWKDMLGERVIILNDHTTIAEVIASMVALIHGIDLDTVTSSFDAKTAGDVKNALVHVSAGLTTQPKNGIVNV